VAEAVVRALGLQEEVVVAQALKTQIAQARQETHLQLHQSKVIKARTLLFLHRTLKLVTEGML
jgi:hypothetical protein